MGKAEAGTAKAVANKIKAKGLLKLKFYCQVCQKQCRDAAGFKNHCLSESHQRMIALYGEKRTQFAENYSREFETDFVELLRQRYGDTSVHANIVYNEYIRDRNHVHMNSTKWSSLASFVAYLGKCKKVIVDESEKGLFIKYIRRDIPWKLTGTEMTMSKSSDEGTIAMQELRRVNSVLKKMKNENNDNESEKEAVSTYLESSTGNESSIKFSLAKPEPPAESLPLLLEDGGDGKESFAASGVIPPRVFSAVRADVKDLVPAKASISSLFDDDDDDDGGGGGGGSEKRSSMQSSTMPRRASSGPGRYFARKS